MGKQCVVCGTSFFSPDDSDKCGKCREKIQQESHEDHGGCGCGHSHWYYFFYTWLGSELNLFDHHLIMFIRPILDASRNGRTIFNLQPQNAS